MGRKLPLLPGSNFAPLKFSELLFILLYLVYFAPQTFVCPSLKYFCLTTVYVF